MSIKNIPIVAPIKRERGRPKKTVEENTIKVVSDDKKAQINALMRSSGALFDTMDLDTYKSRLDGYSLNELHNEAFRVGLKGGQDRSNTVRAILDVFNDYRRKFIPLYDRSVQAGSDDLSPEQRALAMNLMKDGRGSF